MERQTDRQTDRHQERERERERETERERERERERTCLGIMLCSWSATGRRALAATALTSSSTSCRPLRMEGERRGRREAERSWGRRG